MATVHPSLMWEKQADSTTAFVAFSKCHLHYGHSQEMSLQPSKLMAEGLSFPIQFAQ